MSRRAPATAALSGYAAAGGELLAEAAAVADDPTAQPAVLRQVEDRLREAAEEAKRRADEAEVAAGDLVLDATDEELDASDATIRALRRRATRCAGWAEKLAARVFEVETDQAEAERRRRYDAAAERVAGVETWVRGAYAEHAAAIADGLATMIDVAGEVDAANADRPAGAPALDLEAFRSSAPAPGRHALAPAELAGAVFLPRAAYADGDFWPRRSRLWADPAPAASFAEGHAEVEDGGGAVDTVATA